jgi:molybdopterin molybdotransferase
MTGAPIPRGSDTVVPFEDTDETERRQVDGQLAEIAIQKTLRTGSNIRKAGEDVVKGVLLLSQGTLLQPPDIGVLATVGQATARVIRRPTVAILATGDELASPGESLAPGLIYDSNSYTLAAQVAYCGGIPRVLGIAKDQPEELRRHLHRAMEADLVLTSAGVSRGYYDVVKDILAQEGEVAFWTVRMKPGKPLAFGMLGRGQRRVPHLGLPGNPVSSTVCFELYARPAIYKMMGRTDWERPTVKAIFQDAIKNNDGRRVYARVVVSKHNGRYHARTTGLILHGESQWPGDSA